MRMRFYSFFIVVLRGIIFLMRDGLVRLEGVIMIALIVMLFLYI